MIPRSLWKSPTSLEDDRKVKLALYARSFIPEVWIVNLTAGEVEVCQCPVGDNYTSVSCAGRSDTLAIGALRGALIPVAKIFA
jgi:Uma2 family endonuclease